jgi:hypothetical protein
MVGFRRVNWRTCTDPLVSCSVPLLAWCRDCTRSRGLHRRTWRPRCRSHRCGGHAGLRSSRRGDRWSRRSALDGRRTAAGLVRADGALGGARLSGRRLRTTHLGDARLSGRRLRTTHLSGGCGCQTCSRGSAGTSWGAMLCPRLGPRLSPRRRARLRRLANLLPRRRDRTRRGSGCVRPTRCSWRRLRGSHPRLLYRRSSLAALRPLGLPSKPEPGQKALFGRWRRRRIPYGYGALSRPCAGRR